MRAAVIESTEPCARCRQAPLFAGPVGRGAVYCDRCKGELRALEIARKKRIQAARDARLIALGIAR